MAEGSSEAEAGPRLLQYGPNALLAAGTKSPWRILWRQFTALLVHMLVLAAVVSAPLGDFTDALAIGAGMPRRRGPGDSRRSECPSRFYRFRFCE